MQSLIQENKPFIDFSSLNIRTKSQQPYCERIRVNQEEFKPLLDCELAFSRTRSHRAIARELPLLSGLAVLLGLSIVSFSN